MTTTTTRTPAYGYFAEESDPLRPPVDEPTLCSCPLCGWQGELWDAIVNLDDQGRPILCCPRCATRETLAAPERDGVDLDSLPSGHCTMPL